MLRDDMAMMAAALGLGPDEELMAAVEDWSPLGRAALALGELLGETSDPAWAARNQLAEPVWRLLLSVAKLHELAARVRELGSKDTGDYDHWISVLCCLGQGPGLALGERVSDDISARVHQPQRDVGGGGRGNEPLPERKGDDGA